MCVIIMKLAGKPFPEEDIRRAYRRNDDGFGFMYYDPELKTIVTDKSILYTEDEAVKIVEALHDKDLALHFRIRTVGDISDDNCHPFPVLTMEEDGVDVFMMHNGTITGITPEKGESDTIAFVNQILRPILKVDHRLIYEPAFQTLITKYVDRSRLLFMTSDDGLVIINQKEGFTRHDAWVSNLVSFQSPAATTGYSACGTQNAQTTQPPSTQANQTCGTSKTSTPSQSSLITKLIDDAVSEGDRVGIWHQSEPMFYVEGVVIEVFQHSFRAKFSDINNETIEVGFYKESGDSYGTTLRDKYSAMTLATYTAKEAAPKNNIIELPLRREGEDEITGQPVSKEETPKKEVEPTKGEDFTPEGSDFEDRYGGAWLEDSYSAYGNMTLRDVYDLPLAERHYFLETNQERAGAMFLDLLEHYVIVEEEERALDAEDDEEYKEA